MAAQVLDIYLNRKRRDRTDYKNTMLAVPANIVLIVLNDIS